MSFRGRGRDFNRPRDGGRDRGGGRYGRDDPGQYPPPPVGGPPYGGGGGYGEYQDNYYDAGPSRGRRDGPPRGGRPRDGPGNRRGRDQGYGRDRRDPYPTAPGRDRDRHDRGPHPVRPNPSKEVRLERLARERVSRTLFVRNVAYETASDKFRADFERFGEIRELFDSISRRGLAFVTYYDVRGAEAARREMHGTKIYGRSIDVHFGLPKEHDREGPCDRTKNQGSLLASIRPPRPLHPDEVGPLAEQSGAIKTIRDGQHPAEKIVEFYDSRAAVDFHERMAGQAFGGGTLDLQYVWDEGEVVNPDPVRADAVISSTFVNRRELLDREGRSHEYPELFPERYAERRGQSPPRRYGGGGRYDNAPPPAPAHPAQDPGRLEEARKVQNLLASLGSVPSLSAGAGPDTRGPPPPRSGYGGPPPRGPPPEPRRDSYSGPPPGPPLMNYPPGPPPAPYSSAPYPPQSSSYPPPSSSYPPSNYPPGPPPSSYPPQHSPPAPAPLSYPPPHHSAHPPVPPYAPQHSPVASNSALPSQVLAMLQPQQQQQGYLPSPPRQHYDQRPSYSAPPPPQGYQPGPGYNGAPEYSPARPHPGYGSQPPQQQGYDPKSGGDVGSLLAMLNR